MALQHLLGLLPDASWTTHVVALCLIAFGANWIGRVEEEWARMRHARQDVQRGCGVGKHEWRRANVK